MDQGKEWLEEEQPIENDVEESAAVEEPEEVETVEETEDETEIEIEATEEIEVELEGNENLQRFIQLLCDLNNEAAELLKSGNMETLFAMNDTVEEMFGIQNGSEAVEYTIIDEDCQIIYKNFNAIITMIQSNESDEMDAATSEAVKMFVKNIFEANVRIVRTYGLA